MNQQIPKPFDNTARIQRIVPRARQDAWGEDEGDC